MTEVTQKQIADAQERVTELKKVQNYRERLFALIKTPEFKELILEGFCRDEVARFAHQSGNPAATQADRDIAVSMAQAGGHLLRYFEVARLQYDTAQREIDQTEQAIEEAIADQE